MPTSLSKYLKKICRDTFGDFFFFTGKRNFFLPVQQNTDIRFRSYDYVNGLAMPTFFFFFFFLAEHSTRLVFITMVCLYSSNLFWSCSSCCYFCLVGERLFFADRGFQPPDFPHVHMFTDLLNICTLLVLIWYSSAVFVFFLVPVNQFVDTNIAMTIAVLLLQAFLDVN